MDSSAFKTFILRSISAEGHRNILCPSEASSLGVVLDPLTEPEAVGPWADGGEGLVRVSQALPQMLQTLLQPVNGENVNDADEVAMLGPIDHVQRVLQIGQQAPVLDLQTLQLRSVGSDVSWMGVREAAR